jgi:hypothetical protein
MINLKSILIQRKRHYNEFAKTAELFEWVTDQCLADSRFKYNEFLCWIQNNPNITLKIAKKLPTDSIQWSILSAKCSIKEILANLTEPWNRLYLSCNKEITIDFMENFDEIVPPHVENRWNNYYLSNKSISIDDVLNHPKYKWSNNDILYHKNLTLDFVRNNLDKYQWDFAFIMRHHQPSLEDPICNIEFLGENAWYILSQNPIITADFIKAHDETYWDWDWNAILRYARDIKNIMQICPNLLDRHPIILWHHLSSNENITMDIVMAHLNAPWHLPSLSRKPLIMAAVFRGESPSYLLNLWAWDFLSRHAKIKDVLRWPHYPWNWRALTANSNITMEIIETHNTLPWDEISIAENPNITQPYIKKLFDSNKNCEIKLKSIYEYLIKNEYLHDSIACDNAIRRDIQSRMCEIALDRIIPRDLATIVARYIDYY